MKHCSQIDRDQGLLLSDDEVMRKVRAAQAFLSQRTRKRPDMARCLELHRGFVAAKASGTTAEWVSGLADRAHGRAPIKDRTAAVYRAIKTALIHTLMCDVVLTMPPADETDRALAAEVSPSAYKCIVTLVNESHDSHSTKGTWIERTLAELKQWVAGPECAELRSTLMDIWMRAKATMAEKDCTCVTSRHMEDACAEHRASVRAVAAAAAAAAVDHAHDRLAVGGARSNGPTSELSMAGEAAGNAPLRPDRPPHLPSRRGKKPSPPICTEDDGDAVGARTSAHTADRRRSDARSDGVGEGNRRTAKKRRRAFVATPDTFRDRLDCGPSHAAILSDGDTNGSLRDPLDDEDEEMATMQAELRVKTDAFKRAIVAAVTRDKGRDGHDCVGRVQRCRESGDEAAIADAEEDLIDAAARCMAYAVKAAYWNHRTQAYSLNACDAIVASMEDDRMLGPVPTTAEVPEDRVQRRRWRLERMMGDVMGALKAIGDPFAMVRVMAYVPPSMARDCANMVARRA